MMCSKPYRKNGAEFGCGQCMPCRLNRRRAWTLRLMLEQSVYKETMIVTLTYDDEHLESNSLCKTDYRKFLKRLRKHVSPKRIKYFVAGEYGSKTMRPHFHMALFGLTVNFVGLCMRKKLNSLNLYPTEVKQFTKIWGKGDVHFAESNINYLSYIASHMAKGITDKRVFEEKGLTPEFLSSSKGLGWRFLELTVVPWMFTKEGCKYIAETGDVPHTVRIDNRIWALDRFLKGKLRESVGMPRQAPEQTIYKYQLKRELNIERVGDKYLVQKRATDKLKAEQSARLSKIRRAL